MLYCNVVACHLLLQSVKLCMVPMYLCKSFCPQPGVYSTTRCIILLHTRKSLHWETHFLYSFPHSSRSFAYFTVLMSKQRHVHVYIKRASTQNNIMNVI